MTQEIDPSSPFRGVSAQDAHAVIEQIEAAGISFLLLPQSPYGLCWSLELDAEELLSYLQDPLGYSARCHRVTRDQLQAWIAAEGHRDVTCSAQTAKGQSCRNPVRGSTPSNGPKEWVAMQGGYCPIHGGG
ncbi:hypothetical protein R5M92_04260 [Halomonas sp. Bachu 37]|uniref:hypothetical protein n=1 Tax=Halomonas kashgarensis TaxID=3084920 RepID=UPI0032162F79